MSRQERIAELAKEMTRILDGKFNPVPMLDLVDPLDDDEWHAHGSVETPAVQDWAKKAQTLMFSSEATNIFETLMDDLPRKYPTPLDPAADILNMRIEEWHAFFLAGVLFGHRFAGAPMPEIERTCRAILERHTPGETSTGSAG